MKSPHLAFLDSLIGSARDERNADCLRLRRAAFLAKLGRQDMAKAELDRIRDKYVARPDGEVSCWAHLAESHIYFFTELGAQAVDRAKRAYALSAAMGLNDTKAVAAAWLAHYHFGVQALDEMALHAIEAVQLAAGAQHEAAARASLVMALSLHFAARPDLARPWYEACRSHALAEHDEITTSALMYNMTAMRVANMRLLELSGEGITERAETLRLGIDSTLSYDAAIGSLAQDSFAPLLKAQVLSNQREWRQASDIYRAKRDDSIRQGLGRLQCWYIVDLAWCELNLGRQAEALELAESALDSIDKATHLDDEAATFARAAQVFSGVGDLKRAATLQGVAREKFAAFRLRRDHIVSLLGAIRPV